ncbi:MAG: hypothetical protein ABI612_15215 [Betaproteobacteria bacterium]
MHRAIKEIVVGGLVVAALTKKTPSKHSLSSAPAVDSQQIDPSLNQGSFAYPSGSDQFHHLRATFIVPGAI